ncbi:polyphosphate kinase 2 [Helicobacter sp. 13S00401-1]|uniref:polyphosphate kinase 2 n=1 Tax=Helicobacter sp. 13S00401-1 TaxID=1905758 RepID=UPI000BA6CA3F|nr:polyphosphate kinase 2 [Helicobacter sp. 13S00401-1]PAF50388.1 polyphosphate kinase 2 [Helicobacter sp. 13S00401-1]
MGKKQIVIRPEEEKDFKDVYEKTKKGGIYRLKEEFYEKEFRKLEIELVKLQRWVTKTGQKIAIIMEGRDGAGKGGTIKALTNHLNPRGCRVVALNKPTDQEKTQWYFARYISQLPNGGEIVFFDRSWYNRAGVEKVMGFCTQAQYKEFILQVPNVEQMLNASGTMIFKYFLNVSQDEQKRRILRRKDDPLRIWKLSPIDGESLKLWDDYTEAFEKMFSRTHTTHSPWVIVDSTDKKRARLNIARDLLSRIDYEGKDQSSVCLLADPNITGLYAQNFCRVTKEREKMIKEEEKEEHKHHNHHHKDQDSKVDSKKEVDTKKDLDSKKSIEVSKK